MRNNFSSKIFIIIVSGAIIFLTGCARRGYHIDSHVAPSAVPLSGGTSAGALGYQKFSWPLKGNVAVPFGGREDNISIKGIVIQAREGESVVAAQAGRVSFVDEKLKGYGKTIIIEHSPEFATVYARNSEILVTPGQWVKRGQPVAKVGQAGRGNSPQLYFELRRNARAEDPVHYLVR